MFLYTKGKKGNPTEGLRELLHYIENTKQENVKNEKIRAIHNMVKIVKRDAEVSKGYMKIFERERRLRELGHEEGRAKEIISLYLEMGKTKEEIIEQLINRLQISEESAKEYYNQLSKN